MMTRKIQIAPTIYASRFPAITERTARLEQARITGVRNSGRANIEVGLRQA
jgi:hypothetical protein